MPVVDEELAEFQAMVLHTLEAHRDGAEIIELLRQEKSSMPYQSWINQMTPAMVAVGAQLTKKWKNHE